MGDRPKLDEVQRRALADRYADGEGSVRCARLFGVHPSTAIRVVREMGVPVRRRGSRPGPIVTGPQAHPRRGRRLAQNWAEVIEMRNAGQSLTKIAWHFCVSKQAVSQLLSRVDRWIVAGVVGTLNEGGRRDGAARTQDLG